MNASTPNASFIAPARGNYQFILSVTDSHGGTSSASASVRINSVPVLQPVASQSVRAGAALKFSLKATDADGDKLVFHATNLPVGASLSAAGVFSWPNAAPVGSYTIGVAASDNEGSSAPANVTISVSAATLASVSSGRSGGGGAIGGECLLLAAGWMLIRRRRITKQSDDSAVGA